MSKIFDLGEHLRKSRFWSKLMKILILVKIVGNLWSRSTFLENLDFSQYIWYRFDLSQNFPQILVLVKISEKCQFGSKFANMSILLKNFLKSRFWSKISKILILVKLSKNLKFGQICRKMLIWVKLVENSRFWSKFNKMSVLVKTSKSLDLGKNCRKFSIWVKIYQNVDFGQNCRKCWL